MKDIIIVEDGLQERERLLKLFSEAGYRVHACEGVTEAERVLQSTSFRLAILDIGLNDRSGSYLFNALKGAPSAPQIIIFTGNPSVHLKQRFLDGGAVDYVVKASPQAQNDAFLSRIRELLGEPSTETIDGIELDLFLSQYVPEASRQLFFDAQGEVPPCSSCSSQHYVVTFAHQPQVPPEVFGKVVCAECGASMDADIA
ncbi:MAG: response regulator [Bdellovibrionales bacterium]|nr:response regulator [Bdellovibrionales bacterium]